MKLALSEPVVEVLFLFCNVLICIANDDSPGKAYKHNCDINPNKFPSKKVSHEYIVVYRNYYSLNSRRKFLQAAMKNAGIFQWKQLQRSNPASPYPSDFDLIETLEMFGSKTLNIVMAHPVIKSVTPQNLLKRDLRYTENFEDSVLINATEFINLNPKKAKTRDKLFRDRNLLRSMTGQITEVLGANILWNLGISGHGIKVAVFDTGLSRPHPHFKRVRERTNWTNEKSLDDGVSHGTFVAGIIASAQECLGFAPNAELHVYKVFTNAQVSYTSWFLDAFNYAILKKINVINLSIGGPDFLDSPFVEKVLELSANKIIMVSAIGNDGPVYGTLNNPGDQSDVIGVGGINFDENVAKFSSRGMTTWELPRGYGRLKPDIVTYGSQVKGSNVNKGCRLLSGTSVASPVVAGAVTLLASGVLKRIGIVNPSSMKQVLLEGASRLTENNMFEQGHGQLNILKSMELLAAYVPKITLSPAYLDSSEDYMWPYSSQPLYCRSEPMIVNITILNGVAVTGYILEEPVWHPYAQSRGNLLNVSISVSHIIWPWSGWMSVYITVNKGGCDYDGLAKGYIKLTVQSSSDSMSINRTVFFPITAKIIPKPPRQKRILWDQFHNLQYPPGYIPRDNLKVKADPLDWKADHIHTNFRDMYEHLRSSGYYIDVLRGPFNCFDASEYGTVLIVDPEEEYFDKEIMKLRDDVYNHNLSIIVFADWYNTTVMKKIKFFDENTRQWWIPDTGGANVPALNELMKPFGIGMGDFVAEGYYSIGERNMYYASGSVIVKFPETANGMLIGAYLHDQGLEIISNIESKPSAKHFVPVLGLLHANDLRMNHFTRNNNSIFFEPSYVDDAIFNPSVQVEQSIERSPLLNKRTLLNIDVGEVTNKFENGKKGSYRFKGSKQKSMPGGRIAVFGDSNCLDSTHLEKQCYWLLEALLEFTMNSYVPSILKNVNKIVDLKPFKRKTLPLRLLTSNLHLYSKVVDSENISKKREIEYCEKLT